MKRVIPREKDTISLAQNESEHGEKKRNLGPTTQKARDIFPAIGEKTDKGNGKDVRLSRKKCNKQKVISHWGGVVGERVQCSWWQRKTGTLQGPKKV